IHTAQAQHVATAGRYATTLAELGPPPGAHLIPGRLSSGEKGGYRFVMQVSAAGYTIQANPIAFGVSGSRTFFSDDTLVVRYNTTPEPATADSPELP
ncbi:MAG: prepilin-type N-terminal cleavage/methylation domain-containing protein, partial [Bryobacteraceae bacterium]